MIINTQDNDSIKPFLSPSFIPKRDSHKGQNGKVMVIGGSFLFHAAPIWSSDAASYFVDMVHFSSTEENNDVMLSIKKGWHNGIVVPQANIYEYIKEDDAVLLGTGMMRSDAPVPGTVPADLAHALRVKDEGARTYWMTKLLLEAFPDKKWVLDAGALQMMDKAWLAGLKTPPVVTPHQKEFRMLFGQDIAGLDREGKVKAVEQTARLHKCVILLKAGYDIVSDGAKTVIVEGGNAGLTKGGTGDILAGLAVAFYAKMDPLNAAVAASFVLKRTAEEEAKQKGVWFNNSDIIGHLSDTLYLLYKSIPGLTDPL